MRTCATPSAVDHALRVFGVSLTLCVQLRVLDPAMFATVTRTAAAERRCGGAAVGAGERARVQRGRLFCCCVGAWRAKRWRQAGLSRFWMPFSLKATNNSLIPRESATTPT